MSMDNKPSSALFRRAEQLERWEESDTNKESSITKTKCKKIQFSLGCVFLAACASGDKDEVLKLLEVGADIDSTNVDGLSALHQACIDDNLDMVEFLIEHGADINKGDNEGWTPLHATASCGFISIAKYLIEQGADIAAVNNDGELAVDIAESDEMEDMLQQVLNERGIDCDSARNEEERLMLMDAQEWLENGVVRDIPHPKTGATALHVAAAKGYIKVMKLLIQAAVDINSRDYDGWTPLHAAAHWGQKESCEILAENFCNMDIKNYVGQTAFDIADPDVTKLLEELRSKQKLILKERSENYISRNHVLPKKRNSMADKLLLIKDNLSMNHSPVDCDEVLSTDPFSHKEDTENRRNSEDKIVNHNEEKSRSPLAPSNLNKVPNNSVVPNEISSNEDSKKQNEDVIVPLWRRPASFKGIRTVNSKLDDKTIGTTPNAKLLLNSEEKPPEVVLRRTQSFEADEKFYRRYCELRAKINAGNSCPVLLSSSNNTANTNSIDSTAISAPRSNISKEKYSNRKTSLKDNLKLPLNVQDTTTTSFANSTGADSVISAVPSVTATNVSNNKDSVGSNLNGANQVSISAPSTPNLSSGKLSPGNILKNFFKSFVPPVRDEESETQRKAHAKRVRETRRSTQGVTLEEIKSAEQLVKKKQQQQQQLQQATQQVNKANNASGSTVPSDSQILESRRVESPGISVSATITTGSQMLPSSLYSNRDISERRPSWRLKIDNGSKFMLEDARSDKQQIDSSSIDQAQQRWSISQPPVESADTTTITLPLRKVSRSNEENDQDYCNTQDSKTTQGTQALIQRRRRPKRRSTGVVQLDNNDPDDEKQEVNIENGNNVADQTSSEEKAGRTSRLNSTSITDDESNSAITVATRTSTPSSSENGEIDYKKLYEEVLLENNRLKNKMKTFEEQLLDTKSNAIESCLHSPNKSYLSELEKRERRAMERKLSEMEEELKNMEQLRQENQRLKDENGALIRVISKLSK